MLTRKEVEAQYTVSYGRVRDPGKFESEPAWVVAFWDAGLNGMLEEVGGEEEPIWRADLTDEDRAEWPELADAVAVLLTETGNGFVRGIVLYAKDLEG